MAASCSLDLDSMFCPIPCFGKPASGSLMFACYCITANSFALVFAGGSLITLGACRQHGLRF